MNSANRKILTPQTINNVYLGTFEMSFSYAFYLIREIAFGAYQSYASIYSVYTHMQNTLAHVDNCLLFNVYIGQTTRRPAGVCLIVVCVSTCLHLRVEIRDTKIWSTHFVCRKIFALAVPSTDSWNFNCYPSTAVVEREARDICKRFCLYTIRGFFWKETWLYSYH